MKSVFRLPVLLTLLFAVYTATANSQGANQGQREAFGLGSSNLPEAEDAGQPGVGWESLQQLPAFIGSRWVPAALPANERDYLQTLSYPPLKPAYLENAQISVQAILQGDEPLPTETCRFDGMPRAVWYPYPIQFLYSDGYVMIQTNEVIRSVKINGLQHSPNFLSKDMLNSYDMYGERVGMWKDDVLVVDTIGVREDINTYYGVPHDPDLHMVERYRLLENDRLELIATIEAPAYFTGPWEIRRHYLRQEEGSWATRFCIPEQAGGGR